MRVVTLTFKDSDDNLEENEVLTDEQLAERAAESLSEILAQEKNPLEYFEWSVEEQAIEEVK